MTRHFWTRTLTKDVSPAWPCPHCRTGTLVIVPESLIARETIGSARARSDEGWEPSWIDYAFTAWLKCSASDCGQEVALAGKGTVDWFDKWDEEGNSDREWRDEFRPLFCWPMPDIFRVPAKCPADVRRELRAGFSLFWSDQAASAGRIRVSLERLMDHYRIPKRRKANGGTYYDLTLNKRIETFSERESAVGEKLIALKWLGNTASHQGDVSREDLLDGFEILEYLLADLFEEGATRVAALARQLTKKHAQRRM